MTDDRQDAAAALRARGVDQIEPLLDAATPAQIFAACRRFDKRDGAGPGLLAHWIRHATVPEDEPTESNTARLRRRFQEVVADYPPGSMIGIHRAVQADDDERPCDGEMIVLEAAFPLLVIRCDECGFEGALTPRGLRERRD
jgi:hypothetical protein